MPTKKSSILPSGKSKAASKYIVLRDTSEKIDFGWRWNASAACAGTENISLEWADYTLKGLEDILLIERKYTPSELYTNVMTSDYKRFRRELVALNEIKHAYVVMEFTVSDLFGYPWNNAKLPKSVRYKLRPGSEVYYRMTKWAIDFPNINIIFAGAAAKDVVTQLFKRFSNLYAERLDVGSL
jgi:hypothetical protein